MTKRHDWDPQPGDKVIVPAGWICIIRDIEPWWSLDVHLTVRYIVEILTGPEWAVGFDHLPLFRGDFKKYK